MNQKPNDATTRPSEQMARTVAETGADGVYSSGPFIPLRSALSASVMA
jgi:hypothetical protein